MDTPSTEETTEEVQTDPVETEPTGEVETSEESSETEDSSESKKGYNNRVRQLVSENKSLAEKLREAQISQGVNSGFNEGYQPQVQPGQEITPEQYGQDITRSAQALVDIKIKQYEAVNRINTEAMDAVREYPELDPSSDSFDKELSETITEATENYIKANPYSASVKQFVGKMMKPYKGAVNREVGKATETMARQVSQAATKPTGRQPVEKQAAEKTIAELEAELGVMQS